MCSCVNTESPYQLTKNKDEPEQSRVDLLMQLNVARSQVNNFN